LRWCLEAEKALFSDEFPAHSDAVVQLRAFQAMDDPAPAAAPAPAPHAMDTDEAATASSVRAEGWHTRASIAQDCPRVPRVCLPAGTPSMVWWSDCWPTPLPQHRVNRPGSSHEVSADVSCLNVFFSVGLFAYREAHLMYVPLCLARDAGGCLLHDSDAALVGPSALDGYSIGTACHRPSCSCDGAFPDSLGPYPLHLCLAMAVAPRCYPDTCLVMYLT